MTVLVSNTLVNAVISYVSRKSNYSVKVSISKFDSISFHFINLIFFFILLFQQPLIKWTYNSIQTN